MERPNSVLILGVLNLLFAVLGLFGTLGSVMVLLGMNQTNPVYGIMQESFAYRLFMYISVPLGLIFIVVLGLAGVGLVTSKAWGRKLTIFVQGLNIIIRLITLFGNVYTAENGFRWAMMITYLCSMVLSWYILSYIDKPEVQLIFES